MKSIAGNMHGKRFSLYHYYNIYQNISHVCVLFIKIINQACLKEVEISTVRKTLIDLFT